MHTRNERPPGASLRIALCSPDYRSLLAALNGEPTNATYLLQRHVAHQLTKRGHRLTFLAQRDVCDDVCMTDLNEPAQAHHTWSKRRPFVFAKSVAWRIQQSLRVPYLNVFSNYCLYDTCLQSFPGHDIVYERNGLYRTGVARACRRLGLPYILFVEADELLEHEYMGVPIEGLLKWRAAQMFRQNLRKADHIVCVSTSLKKHLISTWKTPSEKISVFPNGVDVQAFRDDNSDRVARRESLEIGRSPLILFVGNFYQWHDVSSLLDAFGRVLTSYPQAGLLLVGDGATRETMQQQAANKGIGHAVHFAGLIPHAEVPAVMSAADIAVVPYPAMEHPLWLSPLKLFEYMAAGRAIVASAIGQVAGIIRHESNGLLVPPGDTALMAAALERLTRDIELRERLGHRARQDAIEHHSWEQYASRLEALFETVIQERQKRSLSPRLSGP